MGRKSWGFYFGWLCILATVLVTSPGRAQNQPSGQGCNTASSNVAAAGIIQATGESLQRKRWQPHGGIIQFAIKSSVRIPENASFLVCFRWRTIPENTEKFDERRPDRLDSNNDHTIWTVTTRIPDNLAKVPPDKVRETALPYVPLVPLADVRIIAVKEDMTLAADVTTVIGITYPLAAIFLAVATIVVALVTLTIITHLRLKHEGIRRAFWLLRIISTTGGYASLSQLQILLWTLVVAASAVYVMALSGDLIEITQWHAGAARHCWRRGARSQSSHRVAKFGRPDRRSSRGAKGSR